MLRSGREVEITKHQAMQFYAIVLTAVCALSLIGPQGVCAFFAPWALACKAFEPHYGKRGVGLAAIGYALAIGLTQALHRVHL